MTKYRLRERTPIYLDPNDHTASIRSKLEGADGDVLVVVVPGGVKCLHDALSFKVLQRHASALGKQLILVSGDPEVRGLARGAGLRVLRSGKSLGIDDPKPFESQGAVGLLGGAYGWGVSQRFLFWVSWVGIILALILPIVGGYLFLPSATVVMHLRTEPVSEVVGVTASLRVSAVDPKQLQVPARVVEVPLEASGRSPATGRLMEPEKAANGRVTFLNYSGETLMISKATRVSTAAGVQFYTVADSLLPTGLQSRSYADVVAVQGGRSGNVGPLTIDRILDPTLAYKAGVVNEVATQGGTDKEVPYVTDEDRAKLKEKVLETARREAIQQVMRLRMEQDSLYPESITTRVSNEEWSVPSGEKVGEVTLRIQGLARGLVFNGKDVNQLLSQYIAKQKGEGYQVVLGTLRVKPLEVYGWDAEKIAFHLETQGQVMPPLNVEALKKALGGKTPQEAQAYLAEQFPLAEWPGVMTAPFWVNRIPKFPWRLSIKVLAAS